MPDFKDWYECASIHQFFIQVLLLLIFMLLAELNAFFLKFVLYVPPSSMLNVVRLLLLAALSTPAVGEYYEYIQARQDQDKQKGIGSNLWLMSE